MTASARCTLFLSRVMGCVSQRCAGFFLVDAICCVLSCKAFAALVLLVVWTSRAAFVSDCVLRAGAEGGTSVVTTVRLLCLMMQDGALCGGAVGVFATVAAGVVCTLGSGWVIGPSLLVIDHMTR